MSPGNQHACRTPTSHECLVIRYHNLNSCCRWWWNLYEESPIHLALETSLILFILWVVFFKKQYNPEVK